MHLITGLLLAALMGKKNTRRRSPLLSLRGPVRADHLLPGRSRFVVDSLVGNERGRSLVEEQVAKIDGVESVRANTISGSVVIVYRSAALEPEILFAALVRVLGLEEELERTPQPSLAREIQEFGKCLNRAVHDQTGGVIDLWTAIPVAVGALGLLKLVSEGARIPSAFTLLWWSYLSLFAKGHVINR